jgi:ABC-2 type transport system ATP-binding protein
MRLAIEAAGLKKAFGATQAVDGVDLEVPVGSVYGVLGPNGAGKTTTIRILATLLRPDHGTASVLGHDVVKDAKEVRRLVSLTGQFASVDADMTGNENLILIARLLGFTREAARARAGELLEVFGLADAARRRVATYSGGMTRRLDVAASIISAPDVLFLDEPTTGLDPHSRSQVWEIVRALVGNGTTVLLTTQYLDEADRLADRIAVVDEGKVIAEGTNSDLKESVGSATLHIRMTSDQGRKEAEMVLRNILGQTTHTVSDPLLLSAPVPDPQTATRAIAELANAGIPLSTFSLAQPSLDEVFLALTGHPAEVANQVEDPEKQMEEVV